MFLYLQMYLFWYREGQAGAIEMLHNYPRILRRNVTTSGQFCIFFMSMNSVPNGITEMYLFFAFNRLILTL